MCTPNSIGILLFSLKVLYDVVPAVLSYYRSKRTGSSSEASSGAASTNVQPTTTTQDPAELPKR